MRILIATAISLLGIFMASESWPHQDHKSTILPFQAGAEYLVLQGNNGPYGHTRHAAYAFDFKMESQTMVTAARSGRVERVIQLFVDDNGTPGEENLIVIEHSDGTFGRYYHLAHGGSMVFEDQYIAQGQPIGYSGNSGASAGPHLHFDVTKNCYEWGCATVPVEFVNACGMKGRAVPDSGELVSACPAPVIRR